MNTGAEGVETALKLARKWGYEKKKIPIDEASSSKQLSTIILAMEIA
jgi:acetylornithine/succinyldiaminopimelate/putrescine aminotransferase